MTYGYDKGSKPWDPSNAAVYAEKLAGHGKEQEFVELFKRIATGLVIGHKEESGEYLNTTLFNLNVSHCYSCHKYAVWVGAKLVFPAKEYAIKAHDDMPDDVRTDFEEAATIIDNSPRGSGALLRLAIQKLMPHIGGKGDNLNDDIGLLVIKGLDIKIQQALDIVRVTGNNAVHPGQIDLKDDKPTVLKLFDLVNVIVESQISAPKHISAMYTSLLPQSARQAIDKRDNKNK